MQLRDAIGNQGRLPGAAGGSECSIGGCHYHRCDAAVVTNQIAIRKKRASHIQADHRSPANASRLSPWTSKFPASGSPIDLDFRFTPTMRMARWFFATVSEGPRCSPNARVSWQALPCVRPRPKARRATEHNCDGATVHGATGAAGCCEWDNLMVMTS